MAAAQMPTPSSGLVIGASTRLRPGVYLLPARGEAPEDATIVIRGDSLNVDLRGVTLRGTPQTVPPNERKGVGIRIEGRNVTLRNAKVHGYKVAIYAKDAPGLKIIDCDLSYNWKQRLLSTMEREDLADWMSFHQNEKDEWLRFGAGIYLRNCDQFEVRGTRIQGGQCGLMFTACDDGLVWNNDFSFLSAVGLGMYRSSNNRIMHNKIDWCVRGYSHGVYNRGQDSTGILIYEQCHRNVFAYNSVTHGGDGFFLWAGQTTMDTGQGGCNDNLLYGNDWSHAPTNGIEATFSRNNFVNNLVMECWHGVWGGYSYETKILGNIFAYNAESIAIEHGQDNLIKGNAFFRDATGIYIWSNERQDPNWGYPKNRDTRSRDYLVEDNLFSHITLGRSRQPDETFADRGTAIRVRATLNFTVAENIYRPVGRLLDLRGPLTNFRFAGAKVQLGEGSGSAGPLERGISEPYTGADIIGGFTDGILPALMQPSGNVVLPYPDGAEGYRKRFRTNWNPLRMPNSVSVGAEKEGQNLWSVPKEALSYAPTPLAGGRNPFLKTDALRGRAYILVDEWGPYDFLRPLLWPRGPVGPGVSGNTTKTRYEVLGPSGKWRVKSKQGIVSVSAEAGRVPGYVDVEIPASASGVVALELEYIGGKTFDVRGVATPAGKPVSFGFRRFEAPIDWTVRLYKWEKSVDSANVHAAPDPAELQRIFLGAPLHQMTTRELNFASGGAFYPGGPTDRFATVAEGSVTVPPGEYTVAVTTDDGIRVWVDGKKVIDEWKYQGPTPYEAKLRLGGLHRIRVEHFEIDGYAALRLNLRPAS
jgi:nitrous oxidase accessory protein NosD